jgi:vacuolar-type H+-ATPase subunit E/Vma4
MKTYGDKEGLKTGLKEIFEKSIREIEEYKRKTLDEMKKSFEEQKKTLISEQDKKIKDELETLRQNLIRKKESEADSAFQKEKDKMVSKVIDSIRKEKKQIAASKRYVSAVRPKIPKDSIIYGSDDIYTHDYKHVFPKMKKLKSGTGIKAKKDNVMIDFTIESLIDANIDTIRESIEEELFR